MNNKNKNLKKKRERKKINKLLLTNTTGQSANGLCQKFSLKTGSTFLTFWHFQRFENNARNNFKAI